MIHGRIKKHGGHREAGMQDMLTPVWEIDPLAGAFGIKRARMKAE